MTLRDLYRVYEWNDEEIEILPFDYYDGMTDAEREDIALTYKGAIKPDDNVKHIVDKLGEIAVYLFWIECGKLVIMLSDELNEINEVLNDNTNGSGMR